jgi:tetratricopeptide (TPR) repeat protein
MSNSQPKSNASTPSTDADTTAAALSAAIPPRERIAQNFLLIWIDANIDESKQDCQNTLTQLRSVVNNINMYTKADQCIQFLNDTQNEKAFIIVSGSLGQHLVPDIHALPQLDAIYIFCGDKSRHEPWAKKWTKIKGVYTDIKLICEALQGAAKQCNEDSVAVSFVSVGEEASNANLNQLEPSFMYTQIFKEILLEMEHDEKSMADLVAHCRALHEKNKVELAIITEFENDYRPKLAIWWYTRECFTYQMLNRALRTLEGDTIIKMGFFVRDLHQQIEQLYQKQISDYPEKSFIVYRGQGLSNTDFGKLQKTKRGLMSFNCFLSTSRNRNVSLDFAKEALTKTNTVGILFKMCINTSISSTPFASVQDMSYLHREAEILFSMHTVFRIGELHKIDNNSALYQVDIELTADDDEQLRNLTELIRKDSAGQTGWSRLGSLLIQIGQFDKAEEVYKALLEQTSNERKKAILYKHVGYIKSQKGDYEKALHYYSKGLALEQKILPPNHPSLATSYNNIGGVCYHMKEYSKALIFYQKDLEISQKTLSSTDSHFAALYNNIGLVCNKMHEYSKALMFFEKVLAIEQKTLPLNHPSLATTYSNIAGVYYSMKEYSKALSFYEKDFEICQKTLPEKHHLLAMSYGNIGSVYLNMKEYSKALSYIEHSLDIYRCTLPPDHPKIRNAQNGIEIAKEKLKSNA